MQCKVEYFQFYKSPLMFLQSISNHDYSPSSITDTTIPRPVMLFSQTPVTLISCPMNRKLSCHKKVRYVKIKVYITTMSNCARQIKEIMDLRKFSFYLKNSKVYALCLNLEYRILSNFQCFFILKLILCKIGIIF